MIDQYGGVSLKGFFFYVFCFMCCFMKIDLLTRLNSSAVSKKKIVLAIMVQLSIKTRINISV